MEFTIFVELPFSFDQKNNSENSVSLFYNRETRSITRTTIFALPRIIATSKDGKYQLIITSLKIVKSGTH